MKEKGKKHTHRGKERNKQKISYACELDNREIKDWDSRKILSLLLTEQTGK